MSIDLVTVNPGIPDEADGIIVSARALPYLHKWMADNGYVKAEDVAA